MIKESTTTISLSEKARIFAEECHAGTNHLYDGQPYTVHLNLVVDIANRFIHLIPEEHRENVLAACWCHDLVEDCRINYNGLKDKFNLEVAELVYAVTNEKGRNRKERANDKYYEGIRETPYATFVKLCDRIANIEYGIEHRSGMLNAYIKENENFMYQMWKLNSAQQVALYKPMFDYMNAILTHGQAALTKSQILK